MNNENVEQPFAVWNNSILEVRDRKTLLLIGFVSQNKKDPKQWYGAYIKKMELSKPCSEESAREWVEAVFHKHIEELNAESEAAND